MKIKYWGVRGSIPVPSGNGFRSDKYGGNTACVEVLADSGDLYILDAGTGIRLLGNELFKRGFAPGQNGKAKILLSHLHWDHIQGLPFFGPAYVPTNTFDIYGGKHDGKLDRKVLQLQQQPPTFPVEFNSEKMPAKKSFIHLKKGGTIENGVKISYEEMNHPNGCLSYKFEENGKIFVYATDNEHDSEIENKAVGCKDLKYLKWIEGADLLVFDAQYTSEEYNPQKFGLKAPSKMFWGHSTYEKGIELALAAGVKHLVLFHHEPMHDDTALDSITKRSHQKLEELGKSGKLLVTMAYEGLEQKI